MKTFLLLFLWFFLLKNYSFAQVINQFDESFFTARTSPTDQPSRIKRLVLDSILKPVKVEIDLLGIATQTGNYDQIEYTTPGASSTAPPEQTTIEDTTPTAPPTLATSTGQPGIRNEIKEECEKSLTTVTIANRLSTTCQGQLIFEENFETLNSSVWTKEIRIPSDYDDGDFVSYQDLEENCYIKDGLLHIVPTLLENTDGFDESRLRTGSLDFDDRCTAFTTNSANECGRTAQFSRILPPIVSSRIGTKETFSFRYGKIDIRAKLPKGDWIFPQLLLEPKKPRQYGERGYASGQIRIGFIRGNDILDNNDNEQIDGYRLYGGVVLATGEKQRETFMKSITRRRHFGDDFHVYSLVWTDEIIKLSVDGLEYGIINGGFKNFKNLQNARIMEKWNNGGLMAPFDTEFFLSIGVSAGGMSDFPDNSKNGARGKPKPWVNNDPKGELKFWNDRSSWQRTWHGESAALKVDYIKVWAL